MYNTSASWKEQIYTNKQCIMNVYFDNVLINSDYILDFKKGGEIFDEEFSLEIATSQYIELKILKDQIATMPEVIRVEFGILLNNNSNTTEIIPIGIYNLESYTDNDDGTLTIKALDNMIKFEFNYDGSTLVNTNGSATLLQVVQDICNQAGVELGSTSFLNSDKQIAVYDNSVSAREYIKYIAESSGGFACIGRDGKLYFKDIYQDTAQISIDMFGAYKWSEEFKISKVHYEDGVRNFTFGDSTRNTLYINQDNMFIVSQTQVQNIYNKVKNLTINSFEGQTIIDPAIDIGDKVLIDGKPVVFQGEITLAGSFIADIKCNIQTKQKEETTVIIPSQVAINRKVQGQIDQVEGSITQLVEETSENTQNISLHEQTINGITNTVSSVETKVNNLQIGARNLALNTRKFFNAGRSGTIGNGLEGTPELLEDTFTPSGYCAKYQYKQSSEKAGIYLMKGLILGTNAQKMKADEIYTLSFYAKASTSTSFSSAGIFAEDQTIITPANLNLTTEWKRFYTTFKWTNTTKLTTCFYIPQGDVTLYLSSFKLEEGNIPTDWVPAPEDIESNLESNYYTKTETESKIDQRADSITSTVTSLQTQVNNIQIGGTNILRGTDIVTALTSSGTWANGTWRSATSGNGTRERIDIIDSPNGNIKKGWRFTRTAESNNGSTDIAQDYVPVANGQTYTMSCWARCVSGNVRLRLQYGKNPWRNNSHPNITDTNWKRYSYTFTVGEQSDGSTNGNTMVYFGLFPYSDNSAGVLEICGLKLESGNKATDWSPAPEDIASNYYTKTETESKIQQKADSITSTVSQNYSTKAETTQAKNEAINSANTSTDNKLANYSTTTQMNSAITQKANEITSTINVVENKIDNLQVGGRNFVLNSAFQKGKITRENGKAGWIFTNINELNTVVKHNGHNSISCIRTNQSSDAWKETTYFYYRDLTQVNNSSEKWTLSFWLYSDDVTWTEDTTNNQFVVVVRIFNGTSQVTYINLPKISDVLKENSGKWIKYVATFDINVDYTYFKFILSPKRNCNCYYTDFKLEKGNVATDWTPAPEDIKEEVDNLQIGARNLAKKGCICPYGSANKTTVDLTNFTKSGKAIISRTAVVNEGPIIDRYAHFETSKNYVISFKLKKIEGNFSNFYIYNDTCNHTNTKVFIDGTYKGTFSQNIDITDDTNIHNYELYFTGNDNSENMNNTSTRHLIFQPMKNTGTATYTIEIDGFKIEKGNKPTDWTPAPEDIESNLEDNYYTKTETETKIDQKADNITSTVNKTISNIQNDYTAKTELGTLIEQNWEHIKVAWNQISQYLQLEGTNGSASLNIYNQSNNKLMTLNANGETYYNGSGNEIGKIGIIRQNNKDILAFSMPVDWNNISSSRSMAWGIFDPNNNFLPIFYLAGLYGANNSEYEGQLVVAGGLSAQDIELEQGIIKASISGFQVLNNNDQVMLSVLKNGSGSSTYFNLLDLISTWYNTTVGCHYLDFHNNRLANLGNVPVSETNDPNLIKVINNIGGFDDSYIYASFKNGGDVFVYSNSSDRNLKKNIKETNISAIELIQKINHVQFDWKSNERHQSIGYIAQEMQEVEESFVHHSKYKDKEDWQINTLSVLATATKAIQEQQEIIEDLKSRIEKLEKEVNK